MAPPYTPHLHTLLDLLHKRRTLVLTGAGCSTASGIPDYRGPKTRHIPRNPVQYQDFIQSADVRKRYWARSFNAWERFNSAQPNPTHRALATLEHRGHIAALVTQNVDRLHHRAGSRRVLELHGALADVRCLHCNTISSRSNLQQRLALLNPQTQDTAPQPLAPDGDAPVTETTIHAFQVADCKTCGGVLKPNVVFFGEHVPRPVYRTSKIFLEDAEALLIVGSSLTVFSGYRFLLKAHQRNIPSVLINVGPTHRGLELFDLVIDAPSQEALPALARLWT